MLGEGPAKALCVGGNLAQDLDRWLAGKPILARPVRALERSYRWCKRNKVVASLMAATVLVFLCGFVAVAWQWRKTHAALDRAIEAENSTATQLELTRNAEQTAIEEKNTAREQEQIATKVRAVLQEIIAQSNVGEQVDAGFAPNPNITVREALDNVVKSFEGKFDGQPRVEAEIRKILALSYHNLGNLLEAENQGRCALELVRRALGPNDRETLHCQYQLARDLIDRMKLVTARELLTDVLRQAHAQFGEDDPLVLEAEFWLGDSYTRVAKTFGHGEQMLAESLAHHKRAFGALDDRYALKLRFVGQIYVLRKQFKQAEPFLNEALSIQRQVLPAQHFETLSTMAALGSVWLNLGRTTAGERLLLDAIAGVTDVFGEDDPQALDCMLYLGRWYSENHRLTDAEKLLSRAIPMQRKIRGYSDPTTLETMQGLAIVYVGLGRHEEAIPLFRELLVVFDRIGHRNFGYFEVQIHLGDALLGIKNYKEAEPLILAACKGLSEHIEELDGHVTQRVMVYAADVAVRLYEAQGKKAEAAKWKDERRKYGKREELK